MMALQFIVLEITVAYRKWWGIHKFLKLPLPTSFSPYFMCAV